MTHEESVARNPRLLFWGRAFVEVKALTAVIVLFYLHREVTLEQVYYLSIFWTIGLVIFEIPSGYLADKIGRQRTLVLAAASYMVFQTVQFFAHGFSQFIVVFGLMSFSFALFSGTEEAMLYESLKELGRENEMTRRNSIQQSAQTVFKMGMAIAGGLIARELLEYQFRILIIINITMAVGSLVIFTLLAEPRHRKSLALNPIEAFRASYHTIRLDPWLLKASLNKIVIFLAVFISWRVFQPVLKEGGFSVVMIGVFDAISFALIFSGQRYIGQIAKRVGTARVLFTTTIVVIVGFGLCVVQTNLWIMFAALNIGIAAGASRLPLFAEAINQRLDSDIRATTLSSLNMIKGIIDIPIFVLCGWLVTYDIKHTFVVSIVLCGLALILLPMREREMNLQPKRPGT